MRGLILFLIVISPTIHAEDTLPKDLKERIEYCLAIIHSGKVDSEPIQSIPEGETKRLLTKAGHLDSPEKWNRSCALSDIQNAAYNRLSLRTFANKIDSAGISASEESFNKWVYQLAAIDTKVAILAIEEGTIDYLWNWYRSKNSNYKQDPKNKALLDNWRNPLLERTGLKGLPYDKGTFEWKSDKGH